MSESKFVIKAGRNKTKAYGKRSEYDWLLGQKIDINGCIFSVSKINTTDGTCSLHSKGDNVYVNNVSCDHVYKSIIESLTEKCRLHGKLFYFPGTHGVEINDSSSGHGGKSIIFILKDGTAETFNNKLSQITIDHRIKQSSLDDGYKFIQNTNLHHLDRWPNYQRVLVAYSKQECNNISTWYLGILMHHSTEVTVILPTVIRAHSINTYRYIADPSTKCIKFTFGEVNLQYLNWLRDETTNGSDGCIKSLTNGPDIIRANLFQRQHTRQLNGILKRHNVEINKNESNLHGKQKPLAHFPQVASSIPKYAIVKGKDGLSLIDIIQKKYSRNLNGRCMKDTTTLNGSHSTLINIECALSSLQYTKKIDQCILVPFVTNDFFKNQNDSVEYAMVKFSNYCNVLQLHSKSIEEFNVGLGDISEGTIKHRIITCDNQTKNLRINFVQNDTMETAVFDISEILLSEQYEHCDIESGLVLSHWYHLDNVNRCKNLDFQTCSLIDHTYGEGFGSRIKTSSKGTNLYLGMKNAARAHPNTRMPDEDVMYSQMWRNHFNPTYEPICQKIVRQLTDQAAKVMILSDHTYDRLLHKVFEIAYGSECEINLSLHGKKRKHNSNPCSIGNFFNTHRRLCNYSILTNGSKSSKCYSFINETHVDDGDKLNAEESNAFCALVHQINEEASSYPKAKKQLKYYQKMQNTFSSLPVPTTCGYKIICNNESDVSEEEEIISLFALVGLGISVRIRSNLYHHFYGSTFSHCTPATLKVKDGHVFLYGDDFKVFAWGAGSKTRPGTRTRRTRRLQR